MTGGYAGNKKELCRFEAKGEEFSIKPLTFEHMSDALSLQDIIMEHMQDKSLLFPLSRAELMESLQIDHVSGAYNQDGNLIAACLWTIVQENEILPLISVPSQKSPSPSTSWQSIRSGEVMAFSNVSLIGLWRSPMLPAQNISMRL